MPKCQKSFQNHVFSSKFRSIFQFFIYRISKNFVLGKRLSGNLSTNDLDELDGVSSKKQYRKNPLLVSDQSSSDKKYRQNPLLKDDHVAFPTSDRRRRRNSARSPFEGSEDHSDRFHQQQPSMSDTQKNNIDENVQVLNYFWPKWRPKSKCSFEIHSNFNFFFGAQHFGFVLIIK